MPTYRSYCRNCPSVCGLLVDVEANHITNIRGDARHPLTGGYFCVKGLASMDLHNGEDRLMSPKARQTDASHKDIDVEDAMDDIHARLSAIIAEHGAGAVGIYYGTGVNNNALGHSAMKGWLHAIGSPYIFSSATIDQSAKWITMARMGAFATGKHSALDADVLMEVGINPAVSHMSFSIPMTAPMRWLRDARKRGMKLIVVDPRRTETARHADIHLALRPGEDAALFAGMIRLVLERGWQDQAFCDRFVSDLDDLRAAVAPFSLDLVAERTGIAASLIEEATGLFARSGRKSAESGTGPNMGGASNLNEHLIEALNAICGGYRRAGDIARQNSALFRRAATREGVHPPHRPWKQGPKLKTVDQGPFFGEYPTALLPRELVGANGHRIRALIVVGGNPLIAIPDPKNTVAAFQQLDLLVTLDPRFTETAMMADYAIPTSLPYERHDYTGMTDGYFHKGFAQIARPLIERPPGVIDDWEFFWGLARRAGTPLALKQPGFGYAHADVPGPTLTLDIASKPTTQALIEWMVSHGTFDYEQLAAAPSGLLNDEELIIEAADRDDGHRLRLCPPDVAVELAGALDVEDGDSLYPFRLIVRRQLESMNSAYSKAAKTRRRHPVNPAFLHPLDMADLAIGDGDRVTIASDHGSIVAVARRDSSLRRQVVSMTHCWGPLDPATDPDGEHGANVGQLISIERDLQTINHMPRQSAIPVSIRPFSRRNVA